MTEKSKYDTFARGSLADDWEKTVEEAAKEAYDGAGEEVGDATHQGVTNHRISTR
jgi:hypothetical protein